MITKFKTNAEVIENGDKYLYGNHIRMPPPWKAATARGCSTRTATNTWISWAASP